MQEETLAYLVRKMNIQSSHLDSSSHKGEFGLLFFLKKSL
jgi:hypothetical protein